jgi:hypothetical protein
MLQASIRKAPLAMASALVLAFACILMDAARLPLPFVSASFGVVGFYCLAVFLFYRS